jgi:hypothetical protein
MDTAAFLCFMAASFGFGFFIGNEWHSFLARGRQK